MKKSKLKKVEIIFKALGNEKRLEILDLIGESNEISLTQIARILKLNLKTTGEHSRRLDDANLIEKRKKERLVLHRLTYLGRGMLSIARRTKNLVE